MPTEIVRVDLASIPGSVCVRGDVDALLVLVTAAGRPVDLFRVPRPADGILSSSVVLARKTAAAPVPPAFAAESSLRVSVVVPTRERPDDLTRCLESLVGVCRTGDEIIVVDNDPASRCTAAVADQFNVRYLVERTRGLNRARNAGLAAANGAVVAFVDDDVVVTDQWLARISGCFSAGAVGCATGLVLPLELETMAQEQFELYTQHRRRLQWRVFSREVMRSSAASIVGVGANMAFRRDLLMALGGFDVRLDAGTRTRSGGDIEMFARVLDSGWLVVYTPEAYVWHRHRRSAREVRSCAFGYGVGTFSMLTKRVGEQGDMGALVTAAWWLLGPWAKAILAMLRRAPAPKWNILLAETAGDLCGPLAFGYETWRRRTRTATVNQS